MAERRMFAKTIIDSDAFLDMSLSTQAFYFHLAMRADDEGFVNNPKKIMRMIGASEDELKILLGKRFIIGFDSGIIVIKHWKIHNYIRQDRVKETNYTTEKQQLIEKGNGVYTKCQSNDGQVTDKCQRRLGKDRLGKDRLDIYAQFEEFWQAYPRKTGKLKAKQAWEKHTPPLDAVLGSLEWQRRQDDWTRDNGKFIPHPTTYINQGRWMDEPKGDSIIDPIKAWGEANGVR